MQRIGNLRKLPAERRRIRAYPVRNAGIPLEKDLTFLPDGEAAKKFRDGFGKIPAKQRGAHLARLIGRLYFDPGPELTAAIREEVRKAKLSNFRPAWINQPCALEIKRYYANQMLRQHPDSIPAMTLLAQLRWLSGQTGPARLLAGEVFDRFLNSKNITFQDVRCLESLNLVFAAGDGEPAAKGAALRENWLRSLESDRRLLGETPQQTMLSTLLLEDSGRADEAFDQLIRLWKNGVRTMIVFRKLESLAVRTSRYREWLNTIAAYESKESAVQISAARRQVQLYREYGMADHARSKMNLLPPLLERRERLLLEHNVLPERKFAAALSSFLIDQCRSSSYIGLYSDNFGMDGLKGRMIRGVMRPNLLPSLTVRSPELNRTLTYLISGTPVTDRGFATLLETWRNLPGNSDIRIPDGEQTAPQLLTLKAVRGCPLNSRELDLLRKTVLHSGVAEDTALLLLELLPEKERAAAAYDLGMKHAADPYHMRRNRRKLIAAVLPSRRETLLRQWAKQSGPESGQKFELLYLCRIYAPAVYPGLQKELVRSTVFLMNSECRLLYGKEEPAKRLRNFFISSEQFPDWEKLLAFDECKDLIASVEKALEDALRDHLMTSDRLVRHYALLAVCDPARKTHWLACAARHDTVPGEASLWLLDALEKTPGWRAQYEKLRKAGRLSPFRMKTYGNNETPTQKP